MRVGIISNWDLQCGNAADARDMQRELEREFEVVGLSPNFEFVRRQLEHEKLDVAIVNWHPARVAASAEDIRWLKAHGAKTILKLQNSTDQYTFAVQNGDILSEADVVLTHEHCTFSSEKVREEVIPVGIPVVKDLPEPYPASWIGTAGFPFPWKRFDVVAEAAKKFGVRCRLIVPKSDQMDTDTFVKGLAGHLGELADVHTAWHSTEAVVRMLAECTVNIFWFESKQPEDKLGQSGSVKMGLAAGRPTVISRHRKLRTLFPYEDELYICQQEGDVYRAVEEILADPERAKKPKRLLEELGWERVGEQYRTLVRELGRNRDSV